MKKENKNFFLKKREIDLLKNLDEIGTALSHELRIKMLNFINDEESATVGQMQKQFDIGQAEASRHLAILRKFGFINNFRRGKYVYYEINDAPNQISIMVIVDIVYQIFEQIHPVKKC